MNKHATVRSTNKTIKNEDGVKFRVKFGLPIEVLHRFPDMSNK